MCYFCKRNYQKPATAGKLRDVVQFTTLDNFQSSIYIKIKSVFFALTELLNYFCKIKVRKIIANKNYFEDFLKEQPQKVQDKIYNIVKDIDTLKRISSNYLILYHQ